jgi:hypothetical protein
MRLLKEKPDETLLKQFDAMLADTPDDERAFQAFLEQHPEFLHTPFLLNHGLHCQAILSQFRLTTALTTDFAYLTKSTNVWWLVLVELEPSSVPLFTSGSTTITPTAELSKRLAQLDSWEYAFKKSKAEILRPLIPLLRPLSDNQVEIRTVLVCGRSGHLLRDPETRDRLVQYEGTKRRILTYDSLRRAYEAGQNRKKNVLSIRKDRIHFKHLWVEPSTMFAYMDSNELKLSAEDKRQLKAWDYQIDEWEQGQALRVNEKYVDVATRLARMPL